MTEPDLQSIHSGCVVLVRHGETAWNREETFRGRADVPLNDTGLAQADAVSCALIRAVRTAEPVAAAHELAVEKHEGLTDFDYGEWQGRTLADIRDSYPELFQQWADRPQSTQIPNGETLGRVRDRAVRAMHEILGSGQGGTIVVVTHRVINKVLLCAMLGLDNSHFWNIFQSNACTNRIVFGLHGPEIHSLNDVSHLKRAGTDILSLDF